MDKLKKARDAQKPKLLFDSKEYTIEKIPLNLRVTIHMERKVERHGIDRDCYVPLDRGGLKDAHELAKYNMDKYFTHRLQSSVGRKAPKRKKLTN